METANQSGHPRIDVRRYRGQTVALEPGTYRVIGHGTLQEAMDQARQQGIERPILRSIRKSDGHFIGAGGG